MRPVGRGQTIGASNPTLVFYTHNNTGAPDITNPGGGTMFDIYSLSFQIFQTATEASYLTPVQVYPVSPGTKQAVATTGADRLSIGRYAASWACPSDAVVGSYEIRWTYKLFSTSAEVTVAQPFEVVAAGGALAGPFYCQLADLRSEGIDSERASDARILAAIQRSSKYIEKVTGRFFEPRYLQLLLDGHGSPCLLLGMPLIAVESLACSLTYLHPETYTIESTLYRAYNRQTYGQLQPDDRNDPRIELYHPGRVESRRRPFEFQQLVFPEGQRNVGLVGVFGYTDYDGSPFGQTPDLIRRACQLLTFRELAKFVSACGDDREESTKRWRLLEEKTRDQSYKLDVNHLKGAFTGDAEIDNILASYVRPPYLGAA